MAHYLVEARPKSGLRELKERLDSGELKAMRPFGSALDHSLNTARMRADGIAVWEEEDYCSPPLAMEREAVLDSYFTDIQVEPVRPGEGWASIEELPSLWDEVAAAEANKPQV